MIPTSTKADSDQVVFWIVLVPEYIPAAEEEDAWKFPVMIGETLFSTILWKIKFTEDRDIYESEEAILID